jgi:regulator of RNase E activity RraA
VLFGRSLGGAVATWLAVEHRPRGLIVESAFRSVPDLAALNFTGSCRCAAWQGSSTRWSG